MFLCSFYATKEKTDARRHLKTYLQGLVSSQYQKAAYQAQQYLPFFFCGHPLLFRYLLIIPPRLVDAFYVNQDALFQLT